jgi:curved DNA-binding protein CbpA
VSITATNEQIKQAYRKLILQYHPDRNNNSDYSTEMSKKINEAYENFNLNAK